MNVLSLGYLLFTFSHSGLVKRLSILTIDIINILISSSQPLNILSILPIVSLLDCPGAHIKYTSVSL